MKNQHNKRTLNPILEVKRFQECKQTLSTCTTNKVIGKKLNQRLIKTYKSEIMPNSKTFHILIGFMSLALIISCKSQPQGTYSTYSELTDNKPYDTLAWNSVSPGMHVSAASIDIRYKKTSVPDKGLKESLSATAWRGERVNAQFLIWTAADLEQVQCASSDLLDENNNRIPANTIQSFFERFVMTDVFGEGCGHRTASDFDSSLVADVLDPIPSFDIEKNTTRPVWLTIDVPGDAVPGNYSGKIIIEGKSQKEKEIPIQLKVQDRTLPDASEWSYHLDLWQNPFAVARYHNVELWSDAHFELLRPLMEMLANAGQKCITSSIMYRPWGGQTFDHFESLIKWQKNVDASWSFDYTDFDKWINFAMDCGISDQINCYTMIPWGNRFSYFDESIARDTTVITIPGTSEYKEIWTPFLRQFVEHLKAKGWYEKTTIALDERKVKDMQNMIAFVRSIAPELKLSLAGGYHPEVNDDFYDLCVASRHSFPLEEIQARSEKGYHTTYYTCCVEEYPNNFTFSPPAEGVYQGWYAAAKGFTGYLRWAYNSWVENPLTDSRFRSWPAGDTYFVYPGAKSSIRFERLREGIQDYTKIQILKEELKANHTEEASSRLQQLDNFLATFELSTLKQTSAEKFVNEGKALVEELSE